MPIDLGLARVLKLLQHLGNPHKSSFKSIHVAGTNGKGSTIAYLSSILTTCKIRVGRFTSPHLIHYNDSVTIDNEPYPIAKFDSFASLVNEKNLTFGLGCTEFELMTATAFKIFEQEKIDLAIIEVGLGGRLDATNVLEAYSSQYAEGTRGGVIVSAITKIGLDHEKFLGNDLAGIAGEKAGIIKKGIPCVVDGTNESPVISKIKNIAVEREALLYLVNGFRDTNNNGETQNEQIGSASFAKECLQTSPLKGEFQLQNLAVALYVIQILIKEYAKLLDKLSVTIDKESIKEGIRTTSWPGRLQELAPKNRPWSVLIDGAHNESAAIELGKYVNETLRVNKGVIFVVAMTEGKSIENLLKHIAVKDTDTLIATSFTVPEKMPWVKCYDPEFLADQAKQYVNDVHVCASEKDNIAHVYDFINSFRENGDNRNIVMCGSLYLCSDILKDYQHS